MPADSVSDEGPLFLVCRQLTGHLAVLSHGREREASSRVSPSKGTNLNSQDQMTSQKPHFQIVWCRGLGFQYTNGAWPVPAPVHALPVDSDVFKM